MTVDAHDIVWMSENWAHTVVRFDPASDTFIKIPIAGREPPNTPGVGNFSIGPDGGIWFARNRRSRNSIRRPASCCNAFLSPSISPIPTTTSSRTTGTSGPAAGGAAAQAGDTIELMDTRTGKLLELHSPSHDSTPARGGFDAEGNPWFGGRGGSLLQLDVKARQIREYAPPRRTSISTRPSPTRRAKYGPASCMAAAWCDSIPRRTAGSNTCCRSLTPTTAGPGSTIPPPRLRSKKETDRSIARFAFLR